MKSDQSSVLDALPAMAWTALSDGSIDLINRRLCDYTGLRSSEKNRGWPALVHPNDLPTLLEEWQSIIASGQAGDMNARVRRADGEYRRFLIQCSPVQDRTGHLSKWCGTATDIEDAQTAEETFRQREFEFQSIVESVPIPVAVTTPTGEVEGLNQLTLDYFGKTFEELKGWTASDVVHPDDLEHTIAAQLAAHQKGDTYNVESRHRRADGVYRWYNVLGMPLRDSSGQILRWFHLLIDIDDRKRAEEALAVSERSLRLTIDTMPAMAWSAHPDGRNELLSKQYVDYVGLTPDQMLAWDSIGALHPDDFDRMVVTWREIVTSGMPGEGEARLRRHDGAYRWFLFRANPLRDDKGNIVRWYGVGTDIDDMKRAQEALAASEGNLQATLDTIPARVGVFSDDGRLVSVNKRTVQLSGIPSVADWRLIFHPDDLPNAESRWNECQITGEDFECEYRARMADGTYRWHLGRRVPMRDEAGKIVRWYGIAHDIEDRKRAEQALQESERQSRLIVDTIPARVGIYDTEGNRISANKRALELSGYSIGSDWREVFHPDDLGRAEELWRTSLASGEPFECEYRARMADGTYRWHIGRRVAMRDETGKVIRWYGVSTDIEDRKRAEQALAASESELRLILDSIPARVSVHDTNGIRVSANRQAIELSGLPGDADWRELFHPDDVGLAERLWRESLAKEEPFEAEYRARMADGTYRWHLGRRVPIRDETGKVIRWYGVSSDIEDRKRAEQALAASERNLRLTVDTIPTLAWAARLDGTAEFLNKHYLDYIGLTAEGAQDWGWAAAVHPDDMTGLAETWQTIMASGKPGETEARLRRHDGEYRWFLFRANPLHDEQGNIVRWYGVNTDIEDRKRSEEGFRAIVETTPECVKVVARDGTVLRTNAAGATMAGVPAIDNVIGQRFFDFVALEHQEKYRQFHEKICAGEKGFLEFDLINVQGVRRHMETHAAPLRTSDGSIAQLGITRDMTARKRAEDALRRSEAFLAEGQHLARMGNLSWHVSSGEIIWSEQLYRIFEFGPDTVVTLDRITSRIHPEDMPMIVNMVERAQHGEREFEYQPRIVLPDKSVKFLHLIAHRAGCHGDGQIEYIGAVLDITQRRLSEEALEKLRSELAQVTRIMSLGVLTASIAHEVNQPLAGIITNASTCLRMLASDPPNVAGAQETARRTIRDGKRAADVIARLRALFTKRAATFEPVDLNDAAREVIALLSADLQRNRVILRTELADELPLLAGDRVQLQQVIMNLLRNAADAMRDIKDRPRHLQVWTKADEDGVRLSVRDAGIGIGPEGNERLFEAFYTTKSDGMGIGLSVSRSIIERHNGRLWAQANDGPGATFAFSIPRGSADATSVQEVATTEAARGNTQIASEFS
ncbi:PAS domain S-box protein [Mesorhizobium sp. 128a]